MCYTPFNRRRATDHARWFETNISYRIPYEEGFEPYVLVQVRFNSRRKNTTCPTSALRLLSLHT